jgi:hypothetical protein
MWFFIILILGICYLLYLTRRTEEDLVVISRDRWKKLQVWFKGDKQVGDY